MIPKGVKWRILYGKPKADSGINFPGRPAPTKIRWTEIEMEGEICDICANS